MKYQDLFNKCRFLAFEYGNIIKSSDSSSVFATYIDSFGCDFMIYYNNLRSSVKKQDGLDVYLGGRRVYHYTEYLDREREYFINGHWVQLADELGLYEFCQRYDETPYSLNHTLAELCRIEAKSNRDFLKKYQTICVAVAKAKGFLTKYGFRYETILSDGNKIELYLRDDVENDKHVELFYNRKSVFTYYWDGTPGGIFDDKGFFVRGSWMVSLEELYKDS